MPTLIGPLTSESCPWPGEHRRTRAPRASSCGVRVVGWKNPSIVHKNLTIISAFLDCAWPSLLSHCWFGIKIIRPVKIEWWAAGVVICLVRGTDCLHVVQLMPLHPKTLSFLATFKCRLVFTFLVSAYPGSSTFAFTAVWMLVGSDSWKPTHCSFSGANPVAMVVALIGKKSAPIRLTQCLSVGWPFPILKY